MVGRPREFDVEQALRRAMEVFWQQGYEATSVQDLLDAMGINRGSMYDTFGDKHALFTAALDHYARTVTGCLEADLAGPGSPIGNIRKVLASMAECCSRERCPGCLAAHAAVELGARDARVRTAARGILARIEKAFQRALRLAVEAGELSRGADTRAQARFLNATLQGLVVLGRTGPPRAALRDVVRIAVAALR